MVWGGAERRKHPRFSLPSTSIYVHSPQGIIGKGRGRIRDISIGGIGIEIETPFEIVPGSNLLLSFSLPSGNGFDSVEGKAVRVSEFSGKKVIGVEFTNLSSSDETKLKEEIMKLQETAKS